MADERRVGSSRMSDRRSAFLLKSRAFRRRSRMAFRPSFCAALEYFSPNSFTASSSFGMLVLSFDVSVAIAGRVSLRDAKWSEEAMIALWERLERARRERRVECWL